MSTTLLTDAELRFSSVIRQYRAKKGETLKEVASALNLGSLSGISDWENGKIRVPATQVPKLKTYLDIPDIEVDLYLQAIAPIHPIISDELYVDKTLCQLIDEGYSVTEVLDIAAKIEDEFPVAKIKQVKHGSNDFGDPRKWDEFAVAYPDSFHLIYHVKSKEFVAYWFVLSITDELYERTLRGENVNKECTYLDTLGFDFKRDHNLYFVDLFRKRHFNNIAANRSILTGFLSYLDSLSVNGHFIKRVVAHASEEKAERLCRDANFRFVCDHQCHRRHRSDDDPTLVPTKIYALDLSEGIMGLLLNYKNKALYHRYEKHFNC